MPSPAHTRGRRSESRLVEQFDRPDLLEASPQVELLYSTGPAVSGQRLRALHFFSAQVNAELVAAHGDPTGHHKRATLFSLKAFLGATS